MQSIRIARFYNKGVTYSGVLHHFVPDFEEVFGELAFRQGCTIDPDSFPDSDEMWGRIETCDLSVPRRH